MTTIRTRRLVLASQSPRRSELLRQAGFEFTVFPSQISEIPDESLNLEAQIQDLARRKAEACLELRKASKGLENLILAADTVVVLDGQILGKPKDRPENAQHLLRLSGRRHGVITALCLLDVDTGEMAIGHELTSVTFRTLSASEIDTYVMTGEGLDKAGGYGIQGAASQFVADIEGTHDNVVGLPLALVHKLLSENGWQINR